MRKTTVVRLRGAKFFDAVNQNYTLLLMLLSVLVGVVIGALKIKNADTEVFLSIAQKLDNYVALRQDKSIFVVFLKTIFSWLPFVATAFLCGTSLAGMATVPLVVGYFGYTYGIISAYLYTTFSIKGIGFCLLVILPANVIISFALMLACRESFAFSLLMAKLALRTKGGTHIYFDFKNYCLRYLFVLLILLSSSLVDCMFFKAFGGFFSF